MITVHTLVIFDVISMSSTTITSTVGMIHIKQKQHPARSDPKP